MFLMFSALSTTFSQLNSQGFYPYFVLAFNSKPLQSQRFFPQIITSFYPYNEMLVFLICTKLKFLIYSMIYAVFTIFYVFIYLMSFTVYINHFFIVFHYFLLHFSFGIYTLLRNLTSLALWLLLSLHRLSGHFLSNKKIPPARIELASNA